MIVYFVRHGQTDDNLLGVDAILGGDAPLNETGIIQINKACSVLRNVSCTPDAIIASRFMRAVQSGKIIASSFNLNLQQNKKIGEVEYGSWTGKTIKEALVKWKKVSSTEIVNFKLSENCESWDEIAKRMKKYILSLNNQGYESVILVSHGAPIRFAITSLVNEEPRSWHSFQAQYDNGSVSCIKLENGVCTPTFLNKT